MAAGKDFTRLTGMFRMKKTPNCTTGTVGGQWLQQFVEIANDALNQPGMSLQFSHWDNGEKPGTLNFRVVQEQPEGRQSAGPPQRGQRYSGNQPQRKSYVPYNQRPKEVEIEEPMYEDDQQGVSERF